MTVRDQGIDSQKDERIVCPACDGRKTIDGEVCELCDGEGFYYPNAIVENKHTSNEKTNLTHKQ